MAAIELEKGVRADYFGSLSSHAPSSLWHTNWRIDDEKGQLTAVGNEITVVADSGETHENVLPENNSRRDMLDEILSDLKAGRPVVNSL